MGDFYELFFEDAEIASRALGIVLTKRGKHDGDDIRMCGVPSSAPTTICNRLIALGHRVAVCEQLEDPAEAKKRGPKSVVQRDVVRLVTPGTITEERLLGARPRQSPGRRPDGCAAARARGAFGLAALDISTGAFSLSETDEAGLAGEIARLEPSEIVAPQAVARRPALQADRRRDAGRRRRRSPARRRRRRRGAARLRGLWRRDARRLRRLLARRDRRRRAGAGLCQAHPDRGAPDPVAADPPGARLRARDRRRDARQSRTDAHAFGRARGVAAGDDRPHGDARRRAAARRTAGEPADRSGRDQRTARRGRLPRRGARRCATPCARRWQARRISYARSRVSASTAAARAIWRRSATGSRRLPRSRGLLEGVDDAPFDAGERLRPAWRRRRRARRRLTANARRRPAARQARRRLRARGRTCRPRRGAGAARREPAGDRRHGGGVRGRRRASGQLKIQHNNFLGYYVETQQAQGEALLKPPLSATFIHRQTMAGAMRFSTHGALRTGDEDRFRRRPRARLELAAFEQLRQAALAQEAPLRGDGRRDRDHRRLRARSRSSPSGATGRGRASTRRWPS